MCDPVSATLATASAGASIFGNNEKNKSLNKIARAQASAAKENFYNERAAIEANADMQLTDIDLQMTEQAMKQSKEEGALLASVGGGNLVAGQSSSKLVQSAIATYGLESAALQGTKNNKLRQIQNTFDINKGNYDAQINKIKSDLNANFKSNTSMAVDAVTAGIGGYSQGLQISNNVKQKELAELQIKALS